VLAQVGEALFEPDTEALGSGGRVTCRFVGVAAGQTELRLVHRRPWEKDVAPTASFAVTVVVAPAGP
jgi:predicted secreted protein